MKWRRNRLRKPGDFEVVKKQGEASADRLLVLIKRPNSMNVSRIGLSVGKRVGNAVARNRIKRRLREAVRDISVSEGWDLLIIARKDASLSSYHELMRSLRYLCRHARICGELSYSDNGVG